MYDPNRHLFDGDSSVNEEKEKTELRIKKLSKNTLKRQKTITCDVAVTINQKQTECACALEINHTQTALEKSNFLYLFRTNSFYFLHPLTKSRFSVFGF